MQNGETKPEKMEMEDGEMDEKKRQVSFQALLYNIDFTALTLQHCCYFITFVSIGTITSSLNSLLIYMIL